jgi:hypothetical protein
MDRDYNALFRLATRGFNEQQVERVQVALSAALLLGVLERLYGNSSLTGPASRLAPLYAEKLRQLQALGETVEVSSAEAAVADGPDSANDFGSGPE